MGNPLSHQRVAGDARLVRLVNRWPKIRAENKLAWSYLYTVLAEGRLTTLVVTASDLSTIQGTDSAAGRRQLKALEKCGLIEVIDHNKRSGVWTIFLNDPVDVAKARLHASQRDGQVEFAFLQEGGFDDEPRYLGDGFAVGGTRPPAATIPPAGAPPHPLSDGGCVDTSAAPKHLTLVRDSSQTLNIQHSEARKVFNSNRVECTTRGGSVDANVTTAARPVSHADGDPPRDPQQFGALVGGLAERLFPSPLSQCHDVEGLADWIFSRVDDARLRRTVCLRVARAVVERRLPRGALEDVTASTAKAAAEGTIRTARWFYFMRAADAAIKQHDRDLR